MSKQWTSRLLVLSIIFLVTAGLVVVGVRYRLEKVESGVCEKAGRVLTKEELRRAVLQSLVDHEIGIANRVCGITRSCTDRVGIVRNPEELAVTKLIEKAVQSDTRTFMENFGLEEIAPGVTPRKEPFDISLLKEPFILMAYDKYSREPGSGMARFYVSTDVQEARFSERLSLYRRLLGYSKYYFYIPRTIFGKSCCDKSVPREKREASYKGFGEVERHLSKFPHPKVVPVSNCGELLTKREQDTGLHLPQPVFLKGE
jgi:hypothetical protein